MNKKIEEWLNTRGRRFVELKLKTFNSLKSIAYPKEEEVNDWAEFFTLSGQIEILVWAFCPKKNKTKFAKEIGDRLSELEEEAIMLNKTEIGDA